MASPNDSPPISAAPGSVRTVFCVKLQREMPGLEKPPWPGELGQRIYQSVSAEAWRQWEERMKMILNEYRLLPWQKEAQSLVARYMEEFFFGDQQSTLPPEYVPEKPRDGA
jgi:Fe-S cluster biosynthesis and repair protein YggX